MTIISLPTNIVVLFIVGRDGAKTRATPTKISAFHWEEVFSKGLSDIKSKYYIIYESNKATN